MPIIPRDERSKGLVISRKIGESIIIETPGGKMEIKLIKDGLTVGKLLFITFDRDEFTIFRKEGYEREKAKRAGRQEILEP